MTLPEDRRQEIIDIARRYDLIIIEDQVQGVFQENPQTPLVSLDPERVIYCGSFSKIFAGGLRVGYILTPTRFLNSIKYLSYAARSFGVKLFSIFITKYFLVEKE